jgi:predicted MFS family arabinose efflux permease
VPEKPNVSLLQEPGFVRLWVMGAIAGTSRWLEMLVIGVFAFDQTGSPFVVALMLFARLLPMGLFGVFGGVISDRFDRRRTLMVTMAIMSTLSLLLGVLGIYGMLTVWHVGLGAFAAGMVWVTDFPVRRTLLSEIAGPGRVARAMSLDIMSSSGTRMLGPIMGGTIYASLGIGGAMLTTAIGYGICLAILYWLQKKDDPPEAAEINVLRNVAEGLAQLRHNRVLVGVFVVTIVFNIWGFPFTSMIPVIGKDILGLGPGGVGVLASAEGLGAFMGAMLLALYAPGAWARYLYVGGVALYFLLLIGFGLSSDTLVSGAILTAAGFSGAGFAAMQSALVLLNSNDMIRARMMGVLSMCIGSGLLGFLHLGWLAAQIGPGEACMVIGIEGAIALGLTVYFWPELLKRQIN